MGSGAGAPAGCGAEPREENFKLNYAKTAKKSAEFEITLTSTLQPCCRQPFLLILLWLAAMPVGHPRSWCCAPHVPKERTERILHASKRPQLLGAARLSEACAMIHAVAAFRFVARGCRKAICHGVRAQRAFRKMGGPL